MSTTEIGPRVFRTKPFELKFIGGGGHDRVPLQPATTERDTFDPLELLEQTHLRAISAMGEFCDFKSSGNRHSASTKPTQKQLSEGDIWLEATVSTYSAGLRERMFSPTRFDIASSRVELKKAVNTPNGLVTKTLYTFGSNSEIYAPFLKGPEGSDIAVMDTRFSASVQKVDRLVTRHVADLRRK